MATKNYNELSRITSSSNLDLIAVVNTGYTETNKINKQNFLNGVSPLIYQKTKQNILNAWCDDLSMSSGQWFSAIVGGYQHRIVGDTQYNSIFGGNRNNIEGGSFGYKTIVGGFDNRINNANGYNGIFAGRNHAINNGDYGMVILGGENCTIQDSNYGMSMVGAVNATANSAGTSIIVGGYYAALNTSTDSFMAGGRSNILNNQFQVGGSAIIVGIDNNLTGSLSAIIGGNQSIITGGTNQVMLATSGRTADANYTTYVENLRVFKQIYNGTYDVGSVSSGTTTLDFDNGNIQYFQLNAGVSATLDASNYKEGATYIVKVKQPSSGAAATLSYTSPLFKFPNGIAPTLSINNNEEDIFSFVCIGGSLYGNIQKTFS